MPAYDKEFMADVPKMVVAADNDEDQAVPVEVKLVVWVKRGAWQDEYGIDPTEPGYDFEEAVQDWVNEEMNLHGVTNDNWPNVTEVTL